MKKQTQELTKVRAIGPTGIEDLDFHLFLAESSHNTALATICRSLIHILFHTIEHIPSGTRENRGIALQHTEIISAVKKRDGNAARRLMYGHVRDMKNLLDSENENNRS